MICVRGHRIEVLNDENGFYIGTNVCRLSDYATSKDEAENLPMDREFVDENSKCNGGRGCFRNF